MENFSTLDLILVAAFCFYALSFLVFLIFFIPVLIQLARTLEAAQVLLNTVKAYEENAKNGLGSIFNSLKNFSNLIFVKSMDFADFLVDKVSGKD